MTPHSYRLAFALIWAPIAAAQIPSESWPPKPPIIPESVKVTSDVRYGSSPQNVLDIMQPAAPTRGLRPGAIVIHGGGWIGGSRAWVAQLVCLRYVEKGFVVANVEYRVASAATAPAAVADVLQAAGWFVDNAAKYGVDPKRIVVTGDSAGGHLALMVGLTPEAAGFGPQQRVHAVVNFFGITDVNDQLAGPNERSYTVEWVPPQPERSELAKRVSPITYVRKQVPPILTMHGTADPSVPYAHAVKLTDALNAVGARAVLVTVEGGSHGFPKAQTDEIYDRYVWPFLSSTGVLKTHVAASQSRSASLSCSPRAQCRFADED
jgi:acetyl esterase/lipase